MNRKKAKKLAFIMSLVILLSALPFFTLEASAYPRVTIRYKVTYRVRYKVSQKNKTPKLSKKKATTTVGEIYSINLKYAKGKKIKWSSSNKRIATVKKDGNWCDITAKKPGKVTITAKYKGKKYKCKLTVKPKKATAFYCTYGGNMEFKNGQYGLYFEPAIALLSFENNVYPLNLICEVDDASIVDCEWDPDAALDLWVTPLREGTTWITITNSYNSQKMRFRAVVGCGYNKYALRFDSTELYFSNYDEEKTLKLIVPEDMNEIDYTLDKKICEVTDVEWKEDYCLLHIKPIKNGEAKITVKDSNDKYVAETAKIVVNAPNKEISTDADDIDINVGETYNLTVSPDFSADITTETNPDILTLKYTKKTAGSNSYNLAITGRNPGTATITLTDKYDSSVYKVVNVNVYDEEGGVTQVSCGREHTAILKEDGSLYMTGGNYYGQLGDKTTTDKESFVKIMDGVVQISCGDYHTGILKEDGSLYMTGNNYYGQLGNKTTTNKKSFVKIMDGVVQVSCGTYHTGILKEDGSLWMTGKNLSGYLGNGTTTDTSTPVKIMDGVVQVSCGGAHTGILKEDGSLWMCGSNEDGALGDGTTDDRITPVKIMDGVAFVDCGGLFTGIIKDDSSLWMCGDNGFGQFGNGQRNNSYIKTPVKVMDGVVQVSCKNNHSGIVKSNGILYMNGYGSDGQLGESRYQRPDTTPVTIPQQ